MTFSFSPPRAGDRKFEMDAITRKNELVKTIEGMITNIDRVLMLCEPYEGDELFTDIRLGTSHWKEYLELLLEKVKELKV